MRGGREEGKASESGQLYPRPHSEYYRGSSIEFFLAQGLENLPKIENLPILLYSVHTVHV